MAAATGSLRIAACLLSAASSWLLRPTPAMAFPISIPSPSTLAPAGGDLAPPSVEALKHQMGLLSGFGSAGLGWTITPRISLVEALTDNVFQAHAPRRWDLISTIAPGVAIAGNTNRIQLRLDYQPTLRIYARTGSQNSLSQYLSLFGTATLVPDLLFVDVRGAAGVVGTNGGIGGVGTLGQSNLGGLTSGGLGQTSALGLSKQNLSQITSFSVSPYILDHISDIGSLRAGVVLSEASSSRLQGFAAFPFETGSNSQRQSSISENASFTTGNNLGRIRYSSRIDASQSTYTGATGVGGSGASQRETFNNQLNYAFSHQIAPYGWVGWERARYTGVNRLDLNGPIWGIGVTLTPNADTSIDVSYGRLNNSTSFRFDARYAITARTTLTGSYTSAVRTQTGLLLQQLNASTVANNGGLVNNQTGGSLFTANNALGVAPGIYRFNLFTLGATSVLARDTISLLVSYSEQTPEGSNSGGVAESVKTAGVSWTHLLTPTLTMIADAYASTGTPSGGIRQDSLSAALSGNYRLSKTVSAFARYAFFGREASQAAATMYQDLVMVGITKQF